MAGRRWAFIESPRSRRASAKLFGAWAETSAQRIAPRDTKTGSTTKVARSIARARLARVSPTGYACQRDKYIPRGPAAHAFRAIHPAWDARLPWRKPGVRQVLCARLQSGGQTNDYPAETAPGPHSARFLRSSFAPG